MLFHSLSYAALLSLAIVACVFTPPRLRWVILLLASFGFYIAWRPEYLALLLVTSTTCHFAAKGIQRTQRNSARRQILFATIALNLTILFLFKYYGLFVQTLRELTSIELNEDLGLLLPVGISFYTFQAIGYVVDVARGKVHPEPTLARTTLFISFFPQLVAGPIERANRLLPALRRPVFFRWRNLRLGAWLILWGLFKKVVLADRLALLVDHAYGTPVEEISAPLLILATYAFAFQIYCDFSGYTDMAIGSARMFGIDLMRNFRTPYLATSLRDFWARWHISLSTWFRDYVYIPLGGSRVSPVRWSFNLLFVFAISGLWHGAKWTYVIWGLIHGLVLLLEAVLCRSSQRSDKTRASLAIQTIQVLITFHIVLLAWVFFRAESVQQAWSILVQVGSWDTYRAWAWPADFSRFEFAIAVTSLMWMLLIESSVRGNTKRIVGVRPRILSRLVIVTTLLIVLNFGIFSNPTQFVYFQF